MPPPPKKKIKVHFKINYHDFFIYIYNPIIFLKKDLYKKKRKKDLEQMMEYTKKIRLTDLNNC